MIDASIFFFYYLITGEFNMLSITPGVYGICSSLSLTNRYFHYSLSSSSTSFLTSYSFIICTIFIIFSLLIVYTSYNFIFIISTLTNFITFILTTSIISINIFYIILSNISKYNSNMNNICSYSIPRRVRYTYKICY